MRLRSRPSRRPFGHPSSSAENVAEVISLEKVSKVYPPSVAALHDVSLSVMRGEMIAVVGPSGSGKSTLLHIMGTLERPSAGTIRIAGSDAGLMNDSSLARLRSREIGFVFQKFFLMDSLSAEENVAQALIYSGVPRSRRGELARRALDEVGLSHRAGQITRKLSGGEQQRVAIARALVNEPSILFADEPTGNLDSVSGAGVMELLRDLHARGNTIVVITHDQVLAASFPRQVGMLDGRVAYDSTAQVTRVDP